MFIPRKKQEEKKDIEDVVRDRDTEKIKGEIDKKEEQKENKYAKFEEKYGEMSTKVLNDLMNGDYVEDKNKYSKKRNSKKSDKIDKRNKKYFYKSKLYKKLYLKEMENKKK